ncbi:hypothetical protein [Paracoccus sp. (in: a-proteobacteria)]|jgi:hypothetical protein|uniref:hypothetical protein n=1 Tax=Paracoccus sp. TaxID=267 RepID=UPI0035B0336D
MATLRRTGYFLWFPASLLAIALLWPLSFFMPIIGEPGQIGDINREFIVNSLALAPVSALWMLYAGIFTVIPAALGWWLGCRVAALSGLSGRKAALCAGLGAAILWLPLLGIAPLISVEFALLFPALIFGGPIMMTLGPILAMLLFHKRFPGAQRAEIQTE